MQYCATVCAMAAATTAAGAGTLIPITNHRDHVFDPQRDLLYITTTAGMIERYDVVAGEFLTPFDVGVSLNGLDITSDARFVYAAEQVQGATQGFIRKVSLVSGQVTNITYDLMFAELGAWDVAITSNFKVWFTTDRSGSGGRVPLREINLFDDTVTIRPAPGSGGSGPNLGPSANIARGANRERLLITEPDLSKGGFFTYDATIDDFPASARAQQFLFNDPPAVNRSGTLMALETGSISILDGDLATVDVLASGRGGIGFDPVRDILYAADTTTDEIVAWHTTNFQELHRIPAGANVVDSQTFGEGVMSFSDDGQYLFLSVSNGIRQITIPEPPCPYDIDENGLVGFGDILRILAAWGACDECPEDVDGDGMVGFEEVLAVLAKWGPCP